MTSFREISREELEQEFTPEEIEDSEQVCTSLVFFYGSLFLMIV